MLIMLPPPLVADILEHNGVLRADNTERLRLRRALGVRAERIAAGAVEHGELLILRDLRAVFGGHGHGLLNELGKLFTALFLAEDGAERAEGVRQVGKIGFNEDAGQTGLLLKRRQIVRNRTF